MQQTGSSTDSTEFETTTKNWETDFRFRRGKKPVSSKFVQNTFDGILEKFERIQNDTDKIQNLTSNVDTSTVKLESPTLASELISNQNSGFTF